MIEENYQEFINTFDEKFDVIIIDGINRFECAVQSLKMLSDDGFIILDNSDWFEESSKFLRENDLIEIDFSLKIGDEIFEEGDHFEKESDGQTKLFLD